MRRAISKVSYFSKKDFFKKWKKVMESKSLEKVPGPQKELKFCSLQRGENFQLGGKSQVSPLLVYVLYAHATIRVWVFS